MNKRTVLLTAALVACVPLLVLPLANAGEEDPGQTAFIGNECNMCHSIDSLGIERTSKSEKMQAGDLSNVGAEHDAAWIVQYVKKEVQLEDADHKKTYKGTDEDLQAIADWLATLKTDG